MKYAIVLFLSIILFNVSAFADQLLIKQYIGRGGTGYVLDTDDTDSCVRLITNLSNLNKYTSEDDHRYLSIETGFRRTFACVKSDGTITKHGYIYQFPFAENGRFCLVYSEWSGIKISETCKKEYYSSRAVITQERSVRNYVRKWQLLLEE